MADATPVTKAELKVELNELENRLLQRIEKVETNLLTAFRTWARRSDTRRTPTTILVNNFDERLGNLEEEAADIRDKISRGGADHRSWWSALRYFPVTAGGS